MSLELMIDVICYFGLLMLLLFMTRIRIPEKVRISIGSLNLPGTILRQSGQMNTRVGLLNTPVLNSGDGLLLRGGRSIHTVGMKYPIDVVFVDALHRVLGWEERVAPGVIKLVGPKGTKYILELGEGSISKYLQGMKVHSIVQVSVGS